MTQNKMHVKKLTVLAMLCALAFVVMLLAHLVPFFAFIPSLPFLKYDPKDVIIVIGGLLFGPLEALAVSVVVSTLEMITISTTGPIGLVMNVLSTAAFVCPAALLYKRRHNMRGAVTGLAAGVLLMTGVMLLWNYLITPMYMKIDREVLVGYLLPGFLPFNLLKAGINMALTLLIYKPVSTALRKARLLPESKGGAQLPGRKRFFSPGLLIFALALLATCVLIVLVFEGVI